MNTNDKPVEEQTTEEVTLPSEGAVDTNISDETTDQPESTTSSNPSEGENTQEDDTDVTVSPRKERDLKRLQSLYEQEKAKRRELEEAYANNKPIPVQANVPSPQFEDPVARRELAEMKAWREQEAQQKWYAEDDGLWKKELDKYSELATRHPKLVQQARAAAQLEQGNGWDHANYSKHLKILAKELGMAEDMGAQREAMRETVISAGQSPKPTNTRVRVPSDFERMKETAYRQGLDATTLANMFDALDQ